MRNRIPVPVLVAAAGGLLVAALSVFYLLKLVPDGQESTLKVPVPTRDIPPYTEIRPPDLRWREIPAGGLEPGAIQDPARIAGRVAARPLVKDQQVTAQELLEPDGAEGYRQVVAVNIDLVRAGGGVIQPGDTVDVYWLPSAEVPGAILATDARVVAFRDAQGGNAGQQAVVSLPGQAGGAFAPAVAVLAVKPEEAPQVVRGAFEKSNNIVLVKKTGGVAIEPQPIQPRQEGAGAAE